MKFKKIMSILAAVSMLSSVFVANAFAAVSTENPMVMKITYTEKDISEDEDFADYAEEYDAYTVKAAIDNYPGAYTNKIGIALTYFKFGYAEVTGLTAGEGEDWWISGAGAFADNAYALAKAPLSTAKRTEGQNNVTLGNATLLVRKNTSMKLVPNDAMVTSVNYTSATDVDVSTYIDYDISSGLIKFDDETAAGFQIGTPAPVAKLAKVVISGATATTLTVGDEVTLTAKAYNDDETEKATAIAWTVEGDAVTVADGLVKAVKEGTATVTATAVDGEITKSASVTFTVETEKLPALPEVTVAGGDVAGQEVKSGENTIGYLWKAIFNAATIKDKYIATFKSGAETNAATLKGFAAQNIEGEGNVSVIVALNTAKAAVTLGITE